MVEVGFDAQLAGPPILVKLNSTVKGLVIAPSGGVRYVDTALARQDHLMATSWLVVFRKAKSMETALQIGVRCACLEFE
ncbi:hypothetical protein LTR08_005384 [Meristemomyces frigidus]|nr:hypothetical protein LTR08_005384 [Meristemomyces frigidus]